jgi:hypothetical protein
MKDSLIAVSNRVRVKYSLTKVSSIIRVTSIAIASMDRVSSYGTKSRITKGNSKIIR